MSKTYFAGIIASTAVLAAVISLSVQTSLASQPQPTNSNSRFSSSSHSLVWQKIRSINLAGVSVYRSKVPGGWLVTTKADATVPFGTGMSFVPDVGHSWVVSIENENSAFVPVPNTASDDGPMDADKAIEFRPRSHSKNLDEKKADTPLPQPRPPIGESFEPGGFAPKEEGE